MGEPAADVAGLGQSARLNRFLNLKSKHPRQHHVSVGAYTTIGRDVGYQQVPRHSRKAFDEVDEPFGSSSPDGAPFRDGSSHEQ